MSQEDADSIRSAYEVWNESGPGWMAPERTEVEEGRR